MLAPKFHALIDQELWTQLIAQIENSNIIKAHALSTISGDAGVKIAAAMSMLPSTGGIVDATGFTNPQNLTGFSIRAGVTVLLGPGLYTMPTASPSIVVHQGGRLAGTGVNNPGATTIRAFNGFSKDLIKCISTAGASQWWHGGMVRDLRLDGNKANNTFGHGISVYGLAEVSMLANLNINECAQGGVFISGSQSGTGTVRNVTTNKNGVAGVWIDNFMSGLSMCGVGGDENPVTFKITNPNNGGGSIYIMDAKSEKLTGGPAFEISGGNSPITLTLAGGNCINSSAADDTLIRILGPSGPSPVITIQGMISSLNYPTIIDDQRAGRKITSTPITYHGLLTYNHPSYAEIAA